MFIRLFLFLIILIQINKGRAPVKIYSSDIDSKATNNKGENYEKSQKHSRKTVDYG